MTTSKHAPTPLPAKPWRIEHEKHGSEIRDAGGNDLLCFDADDPDELAFFEFIVRAVNSHADLIAALREARRWIALDDGAPLSKRELIPMIDAALAASGER